MMKAEVECRYCKKRVQPILRERFMHLGAWCPLCGHFARWVKRKEWEAEYWRQRSWQSLMKEEERNERHE
jgi:hypothetical protein